MDNITIEATKGEEISPYIHFDYAKGDCVIEGQSYFQNAWAFYQPLYDWLIEYFNHKNGLELRLNLSYFNTSSSRCLLAIFEKLKEIEQEGAEIMIVWYYLDSDEEIKEEIQELAEDAGIEIVLRPTKEIPN